MLYPSAARFIKSLLSCGIAWLIVVGSQQAKSQDRVEFLSGTKLEGKVITIRKADKEFEFSATIGGRVTTRTYPFASVHAVTLNGQRHVLTPLGSSSNKATIPSKAPAASSEAQTSTQVVRSPAEIDRMIDLAGKTPPEWFESTEIEYPDTLDLEWPLKPRVEGWHNQINMGNSSGTSSIPMNAGGTRASS